MKKRMFVVLVITLLVLNAGTGSAQTSALAFGSVRAVSVMSSCPTGFNVGTTCFQATVSCPDTENISLIFGVMRPAGFTRGTIVIFNGGGGTIVSGGTYAAAYVANGFETVQVEWEQAWEVTGTTPNIKNAACRPATMLQYFHNNFYRGGGMCAQGSSAGSAAIAYSLAEYGAGNYLDNVELMAGPVLSDIAAGCNPNLSPVDVCLSGCNTGKPPEGGWPDAPQYVDDDEFRIDLWTGVSGNNVCTSPNASRQQYVTWKDMSIVDGLSDSTFSYPQTGVAGWLCSDTSVNCTGAACQNNSSAEGQVFYGQLVREGAPVNVYRVNKCNGNEGVSDGVLPPPDEFETGTTAIVKDMIANCTLRH